MRNSSRSVAGIQPENGDGIGRPIALLARMVEAQVRAGARQRDEEEALLFVVMRALRLIGGRKIAGPVDHAARWRAALTTIRTRKARDRQAGNMNGLELKALAAVHRHQPHGIQMQRGGRDLAKIPLFGEKTSWRTRSSVRWIGRPPPAGTCSRTKFRNCQIATARICAVRSPPGQAPRKVRSIEQIGCEEIPGRGIRAQYRPGLRQPRDAGAPGSRQARSPRASAGRQAPASRATADGGDANRRPEATNRSAASRPTRMSHRRKDRRQGSAGQSRSRTSSRSNRLPRWSTGMPRASSAAAISLSRPLVGKASPDPGARTPCAFQLADARRDARDFIVERFVTPNLDGSDPTPRSDSSARGSIPSEAPIRGATRRSVRTICSVER